MLNISYFGSKISNSIHKLSEKELIWIELKIRCPDDLTDHWVAQSLTFLRHSIFRKISRSYRRRILMMIPFETYHDSRFLI